MREGEPIRNLAETIVALLALVGFALLLAFWGWAIYRIILFAGVF